MRSPRAETSELKRNWMLVLASCVGVGCSSIVLPFYSIGALVNPLTEAFGWSRASVQSAILLSSGLGALTAPAVGVLIDRYGARRVALPTLAGLAAAFFFAASMNGELWMLYAAYAGMALLGAGTTPVTWSRGIATTFQRQRGLALGLTLSGTGICALLVPHYAVWLVEHWGWRGAYFGLGLLPLLLAGPVVLFGFRPRGVGASGTSPQPGESEADAVPAKAWGLTLREAARGYRFWVILSSILAIYLGVSGITPNLIPALTDRGMSSQQAAAAQSSFGAAVIVGRIAIGYLLDRFWAPGVAAIALSLPVAGCLILIEVPGFFLVALAVFIIGFAAGAELDLMAFLAARYFGVRHYAKIYSVLYAGLAIAGGMAPMLFASISDVTGSYRLAFLIAAGLFVFGALVLLTLGRYPRVALASEPGG